MSAVMHAELNHLWQQAADFCWLTLRVTLQSQAAGSLPPFLGSTLRGAFGHAFKEVVCLVRDQDCATCMLRARCPYPYVFETLRPAEATWMRRYETVPHPFVFLPPPQSPTRWTAGDLLHFDFRLFGQAHELLPYCVLAWERMAAEGLGFQRLPFVLQKVEAVQPHLPRPLFTAGQSLDLSGLQPFRLSDLPLPEHFAGSHLALITPLRLQKEGRMLQAELPFKPLVASLLRRLSMLHYFHHGQQLALDFGALTAAAASVPPLQGELRWQSLQRWSNRQQQKMQLGGLQGQVTLPEAAEPFGPLLWLGQFLLAGKNTSFGLGQYRLLAGV